jgi:nucleotide-binding universal stress UspA family protein
MTTSTPHTILPGSVIVGVDGSSHSDVALAWAVDHARARHLPLVVVHGSAPLGVGRIPFADEGRLMLHESAQRVTDHALDRVRLQAPDLAVSVVRRYDDPRQVLIEVAESAAMVVIGTRGLGRLRTLLLGSVSQAVTAHAPCPVTVIRPPELREGPGRDNVVVGVDLDGSSGSALQQAFELAQETGRPLDVVHAWPAHDTIVDATTHLERLDVLDRHERGFAEMIAGYGEKFPDVTVVRRMAGGSPVTTLVELSRTAAHLVLGSRGRHGVPAMLGSVSRSVLERAHCPVTVVRDAGPQQGEQSLSVAAEESRR